jgi:hypothetical protein
LQKLRGAVCFPTSKTSSEKINTNKTRQLSLRSPFGIFFALLNSRLWDPSSIKLKPSESFVGGGGNERNSIRDGSDL